MDTPSEIHSFLLASLKASVPPLQVRKETPDLLEMAGTIPAQQGKQKVDGYYFASVIPKPKDVRFYFFPMYTHMFDFEGISPELRKCLKGKSCFHLKKVDEALKEEINSMIDQGIAIYQSAGLI